MYKMRAILNLFLDYQIVAMLLISDFRLFFQSDIIHMIGDSSISSNIQMGQISVTMYTVFRVTHHYYRRLNSILNLCVT
jgi:predicted acetyltransferase